MPVLHILTKGDRGPRVAELQRALERRGIGRGLGRLDDDGDLGPATWNYWEDVYEALGGKPGTFDGGTTRAKRRYRIVRFPGLRTPMELARAAKWKKPTSTGPAAALAFFRRYHGRREDPPGSNRGTWGLTSWQQSFGPWLIGQAWCGVICGKALQAAGVKGINSRVASVFLILDDALNGRNGFEKCVYRRRTGLGSTSAIRSGDLVGIGGESTHVEMAEKVTRFGVWTRGGNTSPGDGSIADGGAVAYKFRPWSAVVYGARPAYPKG